jgi:CRISPR-associated protein Cas2
MKKDILVSYDVNTQDKEGRRRLRKVAKICQGCGQRVQLSVFECTVNDMEFERLRDRLVRTIDSDEDSLRIYHLRGDRETYLESFGRDSYVDFEEPLIV